MDLTNGIIGLLIFGVLLFTSYRFGLNAGRRHADQILGLEHKKALHRIKNQADRNN